MGNRIISISAAPYDGCEFPQRLESLASCGVRYVEPAFIVGYTEPFGENAFSAKNARLYAGWLSGSGIICHAFSSHIDLGRADAVSVFCGRMDFAARIGAKVINTNATARSNTDGFFQNIGVLARHAKELGMIIGLENPDDGSDSLFNTAQDGIELLDKIGNQHVSLVQEGNNLSQMLFLDGKVAVTASAASLHGLGRATAPSAYRSTMPAPPSRPGSATSPYPRRSSGARTPSSTHADRQGMP